MSLRKVPLEMVVPGEIYQNIQVSVATLKVATTMHHYIENSVEIYLPEPTVKRGSGSKNVTSQATCHKQIAKHVSLAEPCTCITVTLRHKNAPKSL